MSTLYENIEKLCADRGITGYRLCKDLGISPSIVTDLRKGRKKRLSAEYANRIATYFGVSVNQLLTGVEKEKPATEVTGEMDIIRREVAARIAKLTQQELIKVLGYMDSLVENRGRE